MADYTTLSLEVKLNAVDMYRFSMTTIFRRFWWVVLLFSVLAVYLVFQISRGNFQWSWSFGSVFAPLFFFFVFPYAFFIAPYFSSKKYLQKNPNLAGPKNYTFSPDGIEVSGTEAKSHLNWAAILEARETRAQFLFYPQTAMAFVIPKRVLSDPTQVSAFREMIRGQVKKARLRN
jgi:hypothetical protein